MYPKLVGLPTCSLVMVSKMGSCWASLGWVMLRASRFSGLCRPICLLLPQPRHRCSRLTSTTPRRSDAADTGLLATYAALCSSGRLQRDEVQESALLHMDHFVLSLADDTEPSVQQGVYLYGPVGSGESLPALRAVLVCEAVFSSGSRAQAKQ